MAAKTTAVAPTLSAIESSAIAVERGAAKRRKAMRMSCSIDIHFTSRGGRGPGAYAICTRHSCPQGP